MKPARALLVLVLSAIGPLAAAAGPYAVQRDTQKGVLLEITLQDPADTMTDGRLVWDVQLETHAGDLRPLGHDGAARIHAADGAILPAAFTFEVTADSAHHPAGRLVLDVRSLDVDAIQGRGDEADSVRLRLSLHDVAGASERSFEWTVPASLLADEDAVWAYVANAADGTISVIDLQRFEEVARWSVGDEASHGLALLPDGSTLYAGTGANGGVLAIDTRDGSVTTRIPAGINAHGIDRTPDGRYVFVGAGGTNESGQLVRIDTTDGTLRRITEGLDPVGHIDVSPDGRRLYIANLATDSVTVLDVESLELVDRVAVGDGPNESRVTPDGRTLFVANWNSSDVTVIDTTTFERVATLSVGEGTHGVAVSPDGAEVWIANRISNDIVVLDAVGLEPTARLSAGAYANHLTFTPDGALVVVSNARSNEVMVFDAATRTLRATIPVGAEPHEIAIGTAQPTATFAKGPETR